MAGSEPVREAPTPPPPVVTYGAGGDDSGVPPPAAERAASAFGVTARDLSSLSIGAVLALVARCTQSTEDQIRGIAQRIQDRSLQASAISREIQMFTEMANSGRARGEGGDAGDLRTRGTGDESGNASADIADTRRILDAYAPGPGASEEERTRYAAIRSELGADGEGTHVITQEQLDGLIRIRREELTQLNSGTEMEMMELQTLNQQRSQYFTMGTQLIAAFGEVGKSITGNIGR